MRGDLSGTTAAAACRELAASGATGVLELVGIDGPGRLVFDHGVVVDADSPAPTARIGDRLVATGVLDAHDLARVVASSDITDGAWRIGLVLVDEGLVDATTVKQVVEQQIIDAAFELLSWHYGSYAFSATDLPADARIPIRLPVDQLLVEVSRRQQHWAELSASIPVLDAIPRFRAGTATATASLQPDEFAVLSRIDGERSIRTLAEDLGFGTFEAARVVYGLLLLGLVDVDLPVDEVGSALDDAMHGGAGLVGEDGGDGGDGDGRDGLVGEVVDDAVAMDEATAGATAGASEVAAEAADVAAGAAEAAAEPANEAAVDQAPDEAAAVATDATVEPADEVAASDTDEGDDDAPTYAQRRTAASEFASLRAMFGSAADAAPSGHHSAAEQPAADQPKAPDGPDGTQPASAPDPDHPDTPDGTQPASAPDPDHPDTPDDAQPASAPDPDAPPARDPHDDTDVSEFLRELSRLSAAEPAPSRPTSPSSDHSAPPERDHDDDDDKGSKRKRRGLFGRG